MPREAYKFLSPQGQDGPIGYGAPPRDESPGAAGTRRPQKTREPPTGAGTLRAPRLWPDGGARNNVVPRTRGDAQRPSSIRPGQFRRRPIPPPEELAQLSESELRQIHAELEREVHTHAAARTLGSDECRRAGHTS